MNILSKRKKIRSKLITGITLFSALAVFNLPAVANAGQDDVNDDYVTSFYSEAYPKKETSGDFKYRTDKNERLIIEEYIGNDENVKIPSEIDGKQVTTIGSDIFSRNIPFENTIIRTVDIQQSVNEIFAAAFSNCRYLSELTLPDGIDNIPSFTFEGCYNLEKVVIPEGVKSISNKAFDEAGKDTGKPLRIIFKGTEQEWKQIAVAKDGNDALSDADITCEGGVGEAYFSPLISMTNGGDDLTFPKSINSWSYFAQDGTEKESWSLKYTSVVIIAGRADCTSSISMLETALQEAKGNDIKIVFLRIPGEKNDDDWDKLKLKYKNNEYVEFSDYNQLYNYNFANSLLEKYNRSFKFAPASFVFTGLSAHSLIYASDGLHTESLKESIKESLSGEVSRLSFADEDYKMRIGEEHSIKVSTYPEDMPKANIIWTSDNPAIASVGVNGKITAHSAGSTIIHAQLRNSDVSSDCKVTVHFEDVLDESVSFYDAIYWAAKSGITTGMDDNKFHTDDSCTRGQAVTFLWRAAGKPEPSAKDISFYDVKKSSVFAKAIQWALENNITTGFDDGTFRQDDSCTRGQIVTFLWRAAGSKSEEADVNFFDVARDGNVFYDAISWASQNGITTGFKDGSFRQDEKCTRGQIVTFIYRNLEIDSK